MTEPGASRSKSRLLEAAAVLAGAAIGAGLWYGHGREASAPAAVAAVTAMAQAVETGSSGVEKPAAAVAHPATAPLLAAVQAGSRIIAAGDHGVIVLSDDGGKTFRQARSVPTQAPLTSLSFVDPQQGWAAGHDGLILHTADGGHTWKMQNFQPELNAPLFSVLAVDGQHAYAVGGFGTVKSTEDGGEHWTDVTADSLSSDKLHLNAITRLANGDLFIVGEHGLAATSHDGHDWHRLESPYEGSFFGTEPWGAQGAIAFGLRGNIYATADVHAVKWQKVDAGSISSLFGGAATADGKAVLAGADGTLIAVNGSGAARKLSITPTGQGQAGTYVSLVGSSGALMVVGDGGISKIVP
mgnify:CR=1 FL=1